MKLNFKDIEEKGLLLYKYIRGSHVYGTNTETSDIDEGGIYICPNDQLLDLGFDYQNEVCDEKHDTCWWEIGKFMKLLLSSNPTVLEALFVPDDKVLYEHPIITELKKHRDKFITKQCFKPFVGYASSQILKSQGQNKKIHWDIVQMTRKTPLDFCFTFDDKQGSVNIQDWLEQRGLDQRNCGLVNIPNMPMMYGVYYDFGQHMKLAGIDEDYLCNEDNYDNDKFIQYIRHIFLDDFMRFDMSYSFGMSTLWEKLKTPIGKHCGIISPNGTSYESHCRKYREYEEWKQNRNKARYENNLNGKEKENVSKFYDSKNMCHCFRLIQMGIEITHGEGLKLDRRGIDSDFLLDVRNRKYTYEELITRLTSLKSEMDIAIEKSTIPDEIDMNFVNEMLLTIRKKFWKL